MKINKNDNNFVKKKSKRSSLVNSPSNFLLQLHFFSTLFLSISFFAPPDLFEACPENTVSVLLLGPTSNIYTPPCPVVVLVVALNDTLTNREGNRERERERESRIGALLHSSRRRRCARQEKTNPRWVLYFRIAQGDGVTRKTSKLSHLSRARGEDRRKVFLKQQWIY